MRARRVPQNSVTEDWDFTQCFGDRSDLDSITEGDVISTVEFDTTGEFLATGDRGGRIVLFKREEGKLPAPEYRFYTEFQSHDREFDYLKSLEIEERINQIRWCAPTNNAHYLLSANDRTIKLWKTFEKSLKVVSENNGTDRLGPRSFGNVPITRLRLPTMTLHDTIVATTPRRTYANAHAYHINSLSVNSDGETFLSSDDLRVNLWHLNEPDRSFNIVDIRPVSMEELTEVITAVTCHPTQGSEFIYSTCKGNVRLADMRARALCDTSAKTFADPSEVGCGESFFTEITSSISDIKYTPNGRYIVARDFMTVKIWDVKMEREPVEVIPVHDNIKQWLCTSYETDSIFDKFGVEVSGDSRSVMTGSYSSNFFIYPNVIGALDGSVPDSAEADLNSSGNTNTSPTSLTPSAPSAPSASRSRGVIKSDTGLSDDDEDAMEIDSEPEAQDTELDAELDHDLGGFRSSRERGTRRAREPAVVTLTADKNVFRKADEKIKLNRRNKKVDFRKNILHMSWHPFENTVAIAATNNLFMFNAP